MAPIISIQGIEERLDSWLPAPMLRVAHRQRTTAGPDAAWAAASTVRLQDTQLLGRLVRWRIPGTPREIAFDAMFRRPPFLVLEEGERGLLAGVVGRIWTLRRDYPRLEDPAEFRDWSERGTARVVFANWVSSGRQGTELCSETRVQGFGTQGRLGVTSVRPLVRGFQHVIATDGLAAAVRLAEHGMAADASGRGRRAPARSPRPDERQ
jgi:hypothetical protein